MPTSYGVSVFHPNGSFAFGFGELGTEIGEFTGVPRVGFAPNGTILVVQGGRTHALHPNGTLAGVFSGHAHIGATFFPSGAYYTSANSYTDYGSSSLFYPNGTVAASIYGYEVAFAPNGEFAVVIDQWGDNYVEVYHGLVLEAEWEPSLLLQPLLGGGGSGGGGGSTGGPIYTQQPRSLASAPIPTGSTPAFEFGRYGSGPGEFLGALNVAFGPGGIIAVADSGNHRVQIFRPNGEFAFEFGRYGSGVGEFKGPYGPAFGPGGLLAVPDAGNHRVQVFRLQ